jgi:hypothetical protein
VERHAIENTRKGFHLAEYFRKNTSYSINTTNQRNRVLIAAPVMLEAYKEERDGSVKM